MTTLPIQAAQTEPPPEWALRQRHLIHAMKEKNDGLCPDNIGHNDRRRDHGRQVVGGLLWLELAARFDEYH